MTDTRKRQPKGIPVGGEFAANEHDEAETGLVEQEYPEYTPTYRVLSQNIGVFADRIDKANARLERAGVEERFTFEVDKKVITDGEGRMVEVADITLEKPSIKAGPWSFDSTHELTQNGDVLSYYSRDDADRTPAEDMSCEQCGVKRHRGKVYRVTNADTGESKQIGGSCLSIFTGVKPEGLWTLTYQPDMEDITLDDEDIGTYAKLGGSDSAVVDDRGMLLATLRASAQSERGFISKSAAGWNETPTAEVVKGDYTSLTSAEPTPEETAEVEAILDYARNMEGDSDYVQNIRTVFKPSADGTSYIRNKHIALAASVVGSYRRDLERKAERAEREKVNATKQQSFLAPPDTKIKDYAKTNGPVRARVMRVSAGQTQSYGYSEKTPYHVTMMTDDGHVLYWRASDSVGIDSGDYVEVTSATVKDNRVSDYNGDYETVLTRAKLSVVEEPEGEES